jgi:hypothetical protein
MEQFYHLIPSSEKRGQLSLRTQSDFSFEVWVTKNTLPRLNVFLGLRNSAKGPADA